MPPPEFRDGAPAGTSPSAHTTARLSSSGDRLTAWVADLASQDAARSRTQAHWLAQQAREEGTFVGVLADLAERNRSVVVALHNGRLHRGRIVVIGSDFVGISLSGGRGVLLALSAIASIRTAAGEAATSGDRTVVASTTLAEALVALGDERERVLVAGADASNAVSGELRAVGRDVLTLRLDGDGATAYVALTSVAEISLVESG